jgi:hypothetical protein
LPLDELTRSFLTVTSKLSLAERAELEECGKRASDIVNSFYTYWDWDELRRQWIALRLADGGSDSVLYESKRDAVRHQHNEFLCAYLLFNGVGPGGTKPRQMAIYIKFHRDLYRRGFRMPDPDKVNGGYQVAMSARMHDYYRHLIPAATEPTNEEITAITDILARAMRNGGLRT